MISDREEWRPIADTEGRYDVSDMGRVRSWIVPASTRRAERPRILAAAPNTDGYAMVQLFMDGKPRTRLVHNLVLEAFVGSRPGPFPPWEGAHDNGDKTNNRVTNLKWATKHENADDKRRHGTSTALRVSEVRNGATYYRCTKCLGWKPETEFRSIKVPRSICGRASACLVCSKTGCQRKRAFRTTWGGITSLVAARSPAEAKAITVRAALEVYDRRQVKFTDVRAVRAKERDAWAESESTGRTWDESLLPTAIGTPGDRP